MTTKPTIHPDWFSPLYPDPVWDEDAISCGLIHAPDQIKTILALEVEVAELGAEAAPYVVSMLDPRPADYQGAGECRRCSDFAAEVDFERRTS